MTPKRSASPVIKLDMADGERKAYLPVCCKSNIIPIRWELWLDGKKVYQQSKLNGDVMRLDFGVDQAITAGEHDVTVAAIYADSKVLKERRKIIIK